jgi:3-phosphoshikimate 1-carboxyvinyltransferase
MSYPDRLELTPKGKLNASLAVPGSKSLTNRALLVAALADGSSTLRGALVAEDSRVMVEALTTLRIPVRVEGTTFRVEGRGGTIPARSAELDLRLSGTSLRFLTAMLALGRGSYLLDGNARMRERPIEDLLAALRSLGVKAYSRDGTGCPPVIIEAAGLPGGTARVAGERSSQYLSALLMAAPYAESTISLEVEGELQSKPFVDMTLDLMRDFGVRVEREGYGRFTVRPARYRARAYEVEGDATAAGYFWAAAALLGGRVRVENVGLASSQGDKRFAEVLAEMGCRVVWGARSCEVWGPEDGVLKGGSFDLNDMPDQAQTLAVVALFADNPVRILHVPNLRIKETDRLAALGNELRRLGARVEEGPDSLVVHPLERKPAGPIEIETYGDHRMAMALALAGLRLEGVVIKNPACVAKTFPDYFRVLEALA